VNVHHLVFHRLPICDKELDTSNDSIVEWHRFEKVFARKTKIRDQKEILMLKMKRKNPREFLAYATSKFQEFILHQHVQHNGRIRLIEPPLKS
jgi:hypothetical protein